MKTEMAFPDYGSYYTAVVISAKALLCYTIKVIGGHYCLIF
jgi:hypothetical protein